MIWYFVTKLLKRASSFLVLTCISLGIGAFLFGAVVTLTTSVNTFLLREGRALIGGDVVFRSAYPIATTTALFDSLRTEGHIFSEEKQTQVVVRASSSTKTAPVSLRIVSNKFPLYGEVILKDNALFSLSQSGVYVEEELLRQLGLTSQDSILLGDASYRILGIVEKEPDSLAVGISFTPRVIILDEYFAQANIDLSQSRTSYRLFIQESSANPLTATTLQSLKTYAQENKLRFDDAKDGPDRLLRGIASISTFVGIVLSIALFLVTVNIGANLVYVAERFKKTIALLKAFGATNLQIQIIFGLILAFLGGTVGTLGSWGGGYFVQSFGDEVNTLLHSNVTPSSLLVTTLLGGVFGALFIIVSAIPFLTSLRDITPKVLLAQITSTKQKFSLLGRASFLAIPLLLIVTLRFVVRDTTLILISVGVLIVVFSFFTLFSRAILEYLYTKRKRLSFIGSSIISFLKWRGIATAITSASLMTAFTGVFLIAALEKTIIINLNKNIATTAPALYLVEIKKSQIEDVRSIAGETFQEYPIIRGRLLSHNEKDITQSDNPGLTREFNMTYRDMLIDGEKVVEGTFGKALNTNDVTVSVDKGFGDELGGVELGDTLEIFIQGITFKATVTSLREVDSTSGIPFFYLVFPSGFLERFPATYFGTVSTGTEAIATIRQSLSEAYPNIIPLETKNLIANVQAIVSTLVLIVAVISIPSILLGCILIIVMIWQSLYERKSDILILRAFGLTQGKSSKLLALEAGSIVLFSGVSAYLISHAIAYAVARFTFSFTLFSFAYTPLLVLLGSLLCVGIASYGIGILITRLPLKKLLAEK